MSQTVRATSTRRRSPLLPAAWRNFRSRSAKNASASASNWVAVSRIVSPSSTEAIEQLRRGRVEVATVVQVELIDESQAGLRAIDLRAIDLRDGDGTVQLDDGGTGEPCELAVEHGDVHPVVWFVEMACRDGGLQHVRAAAAESERAVERGASLHDLLGVPQRAILVGEQRELTVARTCVAARIVQQHHREQTMTSASCGISSTSARPSQSASAESSPRPV